MTGKRFQSVYDSGDEPLNEKFTRAADGRVYYKTLAGPVVPVALADDGTALHGNPDFETVSGSTPTIWDTTWNTGGSFTTETTDTLFGTRSATVSTSAGGGNHQVLMSNTFTVAGGDTLAIGAWAHNVTGSPQLQIGIVTAASGTPNFFDGVSFVQASDVFTLAATFTRYTKTYPVPAGHTVARLTLRFTPTAAEATSSRVDFTTSIRTGASTPVLPGNSWVKESCRVTTGGLSVTLAGGALATVDGVSLVIGDRVLVTGQGTVAQNGIYTVTVVGSGSNGTWVRASDAATSAQIAGAMTAVSSGGAYAGSRWGVVFKATDTLGTTDMNWSREDTSPGTIQIQADPNQTGWLLCDGTAVSRTTYARLFAVIVTAYGAGNGTTTFNLPDYRDRFHVGASGTKAAASTGGAATHTLTAAEIPDLPVNGQGIYPLFETTGGSSAGYVPTNAGGAGNAAFPFKADGGGGAHNNMPPYLAGYYIIKF